MPNAPQNVSRCLQEHFDDPYHRGECERATHIADGRNEASGCQLRIEIALSDNDDILEVWWEGHGCVNCEGAASILAESVEGQPASRFLALDERNVSFIDCLSAAGVLLSFDENFHSSKQRSSCADLAPAVLLKALTSPLTETDDDLADGTQFGGPSLREEC